METPVMDGLDKALIKCFWHWHETDQDLDKPPLQKGNPFQHIRYLFGTVGFIAYAGSESNIDVFCSLMLSQRWRAEDLGAFGVWATKAGLGERVNALLRLVLHDMKSFWDHAEQFL